VRTPLIVGALGALVALPAAAQQAASLDRVMDELRALNERVGRLERDNEALRAENAELRGKNDRIEATTEYLKDNASATRKQLAEEGPKVAEADRITKAAEWASRLAWKADLRYRHENVDPELAEAQTRHRIRARLGVTARINDTLTGTIQLASSGGNNDPRSTNQTLGEGWTRKGVAIDQAYVDWKPIESFSMQLGKMPQPWQKVGSAFFDNDIMPEGISAKFATGPLFASAFGYYLSERSSASDATLTGGQVGLTGAMGGVKLTGAVGYFDVGAVQDQVTTLVGTCVPNAAFFGGPQGNTVELDVDGCARLVNDFDMIEGIVQADLTLANQPLSLFGQFVQNQEADDLDTGWALGFTFGKAGNPNTWEVGYLYQVTEKDAQFGQFVDSDFAGGVTDSEGGVLRVGYAPAKNWILNGTYFMNDRFVDAPGATELDYGRLQVDLNYKF
jgi:cell division protein FtsB